MVNRPKAIGTAAETAVRNYLLSLGYTTNQVRRNVLTGSQDQGDIHLVLNDELQLVIEVKGGAAAKTASHNQLLEWWKETVAEVDNAKAPRGVLVTQKAGAGPANVGKWRAHAAMMRVPGSEAVGAVVETDARILLVSMNLEDFMELAFPDA